MDVIGSFMTHDMFVAATSESTESVTFVESSQREVVTDSPGRVDSSRSLVRRLADAAMRTACWWIANLLFVVVNRFGLGEPRD